MQSLTSVQNYRGFTLIELLVVVALIGVLATMSLNAFHLVKDRAKIAKASSDIRFLEKELLAWTSEKVVLPATLGLIGRGVDPNNPLSENMHDPWGRPYVYTSTANRTWFGTLNNDFDLYSIGVNGLTDNSIIHAHSQDDIIRGGDGAFCGPALRYGT